MRVKQKVQCLHYVLYSEECTASFIQKVINNNIIMRNDDFSANKELVIFAMSYHICCSTWQVTTFLQKHSM